MFIYSKIFIYHIDVAKRTKILESIALDLFQKGKQLSYKEYRRIVIPYTSLFKTSLIKHFEVEEKAIYPVLIEKAPYVRNVIRELVSTHTAIMKRYREFENIEYITRSLRFLIELMKDLMHHNSTENEFFKSFILSSEETARINELTRISGYSTP